MQSVPGITDLAVFNPLGQPTVAIDVDRARAARYGLAPGDINADDAGADRRPGRRRSVRDGSDRNFPIMVRLARRSTATSLDAIRRITIGAPDAAGGGAAVQVPLADVATVQLVSGASFIYREHQERYIPIKFSVRGRDLGSAVLEAQAQGRRSRSRCPAAIAWNGSASSAICRTRCSGWRSSCRSSLALIGILLFVNFGSLRDTLLAASVMPMALIGGIFALFVHRHAVQRLGGDRLRRAVRHRGRWTASSCCPTTTCTSSRAWTASSAIAAHLPGPDAAGGDDLHRRLRRAAAGGASPPASAPRCRSRWRWWWSAACCWRRS